jgi:hypothetical protein
MITAVLLSLVRIIFITGARAHLNFALNKDKELSDSETDPELHNFFVLPKKKSWIINVSGFSIIRK